MREVRPEGSVAKSLHREGKSSGLFDLNPVSLASFILKHQFLKIRLSARRGLFGSKESETEQQRECETERSLASLWVCLFAWFYFCLWFRLVFGVSGHVLLSVAYFQPLGTLELRFCLSKMQIFLGLRAYPVPGAATGPSVIITTSRVQEA